jgi:hypothetical protein
LRPIAKLAAATAQSDLEASGKATLRKGEIDLARQHQPQTNRYGNSAAPLISPFPDSHGP